MTHHVFFIAIFVALLVCSPIPLTDGLPFQPLVMVRDRTPRIQIVQPADDEPNSRLFPMGLPRSAET